MRVTTLLLLVLALAPFAWADEETAFYFVQRAQRALEANKLEDARGFVAKSLAEEKNYPPALVVAAEVARRDGDRALALKHLETCLDQKSRRGLSAASLTALKDAEKALGELDGARVEFAKLVDGHVVRLRKLAQRSAKRNPAQTQECYRAILRLRPDDAEAKAGAAAAPAPTRGDAAKGQPLFNGKDLDGWTGKPPAWTVEDGVLVGSLPDAANLNRCMTELKSDFVLTCELRVVRYLGPNPVLGIVIGVKGPYDHMGLWVWKDAWTLDRTTGEHERTEWQRKAHKKFRGPFKRSGWHVYEIARKGRRITCSVDGQELWSFAGVDRSPDGYVGLWVQEERVEIRKVLLDVK